MTLCPIALAIGCEKCSLFKLCPLKAIAGDQKKKIEPVPYVRTVYGGKYWKPQKPQKTKRTGFNQPPFGLRTLYKKIKLKK